MGCDARVYLRRQGYSCIADLKWYYLPFNFGWAGVFCFVALGERGVGVVCGRVEKVLCIDFAYICIRKYDLRL